MYTVYVLQNQVGKLYIGQTSNLKKRLIEHNETGMGYTAKHKPWRLLWSEVFQTRQESMRHEKYLKTGVGRDWIKKDILRA